MKEARREQINAMGIKDALSSFDNYSRVDLALTNAISEPKGVSTRRIRVAVSGTPISFDRIQDSQRVV